MGELTDIANRTTWGCPELEDSSSSTIESQLIDPEFRDVRPKVVEQPKDSNRKVYELGKYTLLFDKRASHNRHFTDIGKTDRKVYAKGLPIGVNPKCLEREFKIMNELGDHPNLYQPLHILPELPEMGVSALMIMSHMGDALNQLFNPSYPLPMLDVEIVASIVQTAQALQYVHEQGFLHRDIKPSNIFLGEDNFTRLADFGLCMKPDDVHYLFTGTPMYMSRQQARGDGPSTEQDIWSLGNTAIHMLTKEYPFDMTKHPKIAQNTLLPNYESPNHNQNIFAAKFFPLGGVLNQVNKRDPRTWPTLSLIIQAGKQYMSLQGYEHPAIS